MALTELFTKYRCWVLSSGVARSTDPECRNRFFHYSVFVLLGVPTMLTFGLYHVSIANYRLGILIFLSGTGLMFGWNYLRQTGRELLVYRSNAFFYALLLFYMLILGGTGGSKLLWIYTFPLIVFFMLGRYEGLAWNSAMLVLSLVTLFAGSELLPVYAYSDEFKLRFAISYLVVSALAYWSEYLRHKYRLGIEEKAKLLEVEKQLLQENIEQRVQAEKEKDLLIEKLQSTLEEVDTLRGLLPICSYCHKIRDDEGFWSRLESYLEQRADVSFSHGICPDCRDKHFPEYSKKQSR